MKAIIVNKNKQIEVKEVSMPSPEKGEALVKIHYTGICGSDLFHLSGDNPRSVLPLIAGHEISGEIVSIHSKSSQWEIGDKITVFPALSCGKCEACRSGHPQMHRPLRMIGVQVPGGFAEYCTIPLENLISVPENVDLKTIALSEPLAVAIHGIRLARVETGDTALVIGAGPIGIMTAILLRQSGCSLTVISEISEERLDFAKKLGLECVNPKNQDPADYIRKKTNNRGANIIIECVGHPSTIPLTIEAGALYSRTIIIGAFHSEGAQVDFFGMSRKEQTICASWQYTLDDFRRAVDILGTSDFAFNQLITDVLSPEKIKDGMEMMIRGAAMKVLIDFTNQT